MDPHSISGATQKAIIETQRVKRRTGVHAFSLAYMSLLPLRLSEISDLGDRARN
jgi:hypothetical protein